MRVETIGQHVSGLAEMRLASCQAETYPEPRVDDLMNFGWEASSRATEAVLSIPFCCLGLLAGPNRGTVDNLDVVVRLQNICYKSPRKMAQCGSRLRVDVSRRACGVASADIRWSIA